MHTPPPDTEQNELDLGRLDSLTLPAEVPGETSAAGRRSRRDRVSVDLHGYGYSLKERAAELNVTPAALLRKTIRDVFGLSEQRVVSNGTRKRPPSRSIVKVTLRLSPDHASILASRARASDVAQGAYVGGLLDAMPPAPLPADHATAIEALMKSTDHLAAMSADLNTFMRLLGRIPSEQLAPLRERTRSLHNDVRTHLSLSAALMAELKPSRKQRE